ncbi:unnamed protein product [Didymodactylos carnosus]|uniref:Uncharacterized protein n=1 Tax=Didymodactylos carnosus TaxID=1234261 RepID=A0A8S2FB38_9BILA|nr:unnamed protein product [Didymodactylos carnosus]CAF4211779.1 unnamed protein product [Didymodactylos carnosus]
MNDGFFKESDYYSYSKFRRSQYYGRFFMYRIFLTVAFILWVCLGRMDKDKSVPFEQYTDSWNKRQQQLKANQLTSNLDYADYVKSQRFGSR